MYARRLESGICRSDGVRRGAAGLRGDLRALRRESSGSFALDSHIRILRFRSPRTGEYADEAEESRTEASDYGLQGVAISRR